jgi:hypothetical protein
LLVQMILRDGEVRTPHEADRFACLDSLIGTLTLSRGAQAHGEAIAALLGLALERLAVTQSMQLRQESFRTADYCRALQKKCELGACAFFLCASPGRLSDARRVLQALLVLFARMLVHDLASTLAVLQTHQWGAAASDRGLQPGGGLGLLLALWAREHSDICGNYDLKVLSAALGVLLCHGPGEAMAMAVPGRRIVDVSEPRMTRYQARELNDQAKAEGQWTYLPFGAKAVWLLVEAVQSEDKEALLAEQDQHANEQDDEDEGSDGDFEGSGSDGSVHSTGDDEACVAGIRGRPAMKAGERHWNSSQSPASHSARPSTDEAAARREMLRSIMRGMSHMREDETDPDRHGDPAAAASSVRFFPI